jgi:hypothetical protein
LQTYIYRLLAVCVPKALSAVISISLVQKSRQASIDFATPKDGLIYDKGEQGSDWEIEEFFPVICS